VWTFNGLMTRINWLFLEKKFDEGLELKFMIRENLLEKLKFKIVKVYKLTALQD
jgi:hypothetical protein